VETAIDLPSLTTLLERLIMMSDGTVTPMVEHLAGERLAVARLRQSLGCSDPHAHDLLAVPPDEELLIRRTSLVGADTGTVYVEARSEIVLRALPPGLRVAILGTEEPIGRLLRDQRVEAFREIVTHQAPSVVSPARPSRQYRAFIGGVPAFLITESFSLDRLSFARR